MYYIFFKLIIFDYLVFKIVYWFHLTIYQNNDTKNQYCTGKTNALNSNIPRKRQNSNDSPKKTNDIKISLPN